MADQAHDEAAAGQSDAAASAKSMTVEEAAPAGQSEAPASARQIIITGVNLNTGKSGSTFQRCTTTA